MVSLVVEKIFVVYKEMVLIFWFEEVGIYDVGLVGGKNFFLGEMIQQLINKGVNVFFGFVIIVYVYCYFI